MLAPLVTIAQAIAATVPLGLDLTIPKPCAAQNPTKDEIVVCGRRDSSDRYRIKPSPVPESYLLKAERQVADGVAISAETERVEIGGVPSNRVMLRLKFKF